MNRTRENHLRNGNDGFEQIVQLLLLLLLRVTRLLSLRVTNAMHSNFSSTQLFRFVILRITYREKDAPFQYIPSSHSEHTPAPSYLKTICTVP